MEYGLVLLWLVAFFALGLAGLPLAAVLFRELPDRGAGVAIPLSLTVVTVVVFWVGHASFGWPTLLVGLVVLGGASLAALRYGEVDLDWRLVGETGVVFAGSFLFLVAIRAVDPAVHPVLGEKFLDFGLMQSLLRADRLPPEDMWFAGEPVSYYYVGHLMSVLLAMLTGTAAKYAYNLALAGFYAMLVTAAYGLGGALADARGASRLTGGIWAAFFVGFASNLRTAGQFLLWVLPDAVAQPLARNVTGDPEEAAALLAGPDSFRYWDASRIIDGTINEFPLFSWLNGDLQAHMIGMPFLLLLTALCLSYFWTPERQINRRRALLFGAVPVVGGVLGAIVTWVFPSVMGLAALALMFGPADPATLLPARASDRARAIAGKSRAIAEAIRMVTAGVLAVVIQALAALWAMPFLLTPSAPWEIAFFPARSGLGDLLVVHGAFLAVFVVYLLSRAPPLDQNGWLQVGIVAGGTLVTSVIVDAAAVGLFAPLLVGAWVLLRRGAAGAGAGGAGVPEETTETGTVADGSGDGRWPRLGTASAAGDPTLGFETVLLVAGLGLALIVEFAYVDELAGPERFNTVFKTYMQVWVLWGVAAGAMVATTLHERLGGGPDRATTVLSRANLTRVGLAVLIVSTSLYGAMALPAHFQGEGYYSVYATADDPTLDGTQFVAEGHPEEAEAIRWIDDLEGQPTIVTAAPGGYFWYPSDGKGASAPASLTGVPTVLGWYHEIGYRGWGPYLERVDHVELIYTGKLDDGERDPARQAELLAKYDVEYVYVGPAERAKYDGITFEGIEGVGEPKQFGDVLIYPVDPENVSA